MDTFLFDKGVTVFDVLTGFQGIVTSRCDNITGCNQYLIQPPVKDGKFVEPQWFDERRLKVDTSVVVVNPIK